MVKTLALVLIAVTCSAFPVRANDSAPVKCGANQDRVWVYDSLNSLDIESKIRCGETVEIISRTKGYVKIRTADGSEGYVLESAIPGLPPLEDSNPAPASTSATATTESLGAIARRVAPHPAAPLANSADAASAISNAPVSRAPMPSPVATTATSQPMPTSAADKSLLVVSTNANSAPMHTASTAVAENSAASKVTVSAPASTTLTSSPSSKHESSVSVSPATAPAKPALTQPPARNANPTPPVSIPSPAPSKSAPKINMESAANIPLAPAAAAPPGMRTVSAVADSEDFPEPQPLVSDSADPACQSYFSAYGLAPSQLKWIVQDRKKEFPSICPASDPSKVDFVIILTHDNEAYISSLPTPVHTYKDGFSDFNAIMGVDNADISTSDADKAHHQFVWVFLMKRGTFNPATFSPRRRYQFTKVESNSAGSKAGVKSVEDAFEFAATQPPTR